MTIKTWILPSIVMGRGKSFLCHTNISTKGHTTTGLTKHLQYKHRKEDEKLNERSASSMGTDTDTGKIKDLMIMT